MGKPQRTCALRKITLTTGERPGYRRDDDVLRKRQLMTDEGPRLRMPTLEWLDGLPRDPDALLAELREDTEDSSPWSSDHQILDALRDLHSVADLVLPTEVRVALLGAMARMTGLTVRTVVVAEREYVAIRHGEVDDTQELLFDPDTGRAAGSRSVAGPDPDTPPGPGDPERVTSWYLWTQVLVDEVGARS